MCVRAPAPLDAADGAPATDGPEPVEADRARVLAAVEDGRHLALAWYTTYVDFEKWSCVGLPAWLGGEVPIGEEEGESKEAWRCDAVAVMRERG